MRKPTQTSMSRKPQIPVAEVSVHWAAKGIHVFQTPISRFKEAVKLAKENEWKRNENL